LLKKVVEVVEVAEVEEANEAELSIRNIGRTKDVSIGV
jgi:hypothetical protein